MYGTAWHDRHRTASHCTHVLHCTALHCTALHCTCTALHCTALHCTALHSTVLHCTVLYCIMYTTVCSTVEYNTIPTCTEAGVLYTMLISGLIERTSVSRISHPATVNHWAGSFLSATNDPARRSRSNRSRPLVH